MPSAPMCRSTAQVPIHARRWFLQPPALHSFRERARPTISPCCADLLPRPCTGLGGSSLHVEGLTQCSRKVQQLPSWTAQPHVPPDLSHPRTAWAPIPPTVSRLSQSSFPRRRAHTRVSLCPPGHFEQRTCGSPCLTVVQTLPRTRFCNSAFGGVLARQAAPADPSSGEQEKEKLRWVRLRQQLRHWHIGRWHRPGQETQPFAHGGEMV